MSELLTLSGYDEAGNSREVKVRVENNAVKLTGHRLSYIWAATGIGNAPDATNMDDGTIGADLAGIATGLTYHVVAGTWIATGGTVLQLYGGA